MRELVGDLEGVGRQLLGLSAASTGIPDCSRFFETERPVLTASRDAGPTAGLHHLNRQMAALPEASRPADRGAGRSYAETD